MKDLLNIIAANRQGKPRGIYAICTAHPVVLEAALYQGKAAATPVLIEATANQVNQFGGYTGMTPADFRPFVEAIAQRVGFPIEKLILGGDHLGPVCWRNEPAAKAMEKASELIAAYVSAGFKKIHLDTSMACADDPGALDDVTVAERAAILCRVAEQTAERVFGHSDLVYVVGTEVPPPGGATEALETLQVTPATQVEQTLTAHQEAFFELGLESAWSRVVGLVVQPGVEFDHTAIHHYVPEAAQELSQFVLQVPNLVYEAHSTDYQSEAAYKALVRGHFAILKVGPQLTYALREALFALSHIEDELVAEGTRSNLRVVCERCMLDAPEKWDSYYPQDDTMGRLYRRYSYSDRIRYYWHDDEVVSAVERLLENLAKVDIPLPLLSQYLPQQYQAISSGDLSMNPKDMIHYQITQVTDRYASACWGSETR